MLLRELSSTGYPPADLMLGDIFSQGTFANVAEGTAATERFFAQCPDSLDTQGLFLLTFYDLKDIGRKVLPRQRARLRADEAGRLVGRWPGVWSLEFAVTPPKDHEALRKRVREEAQSLIVRQGELYRALAPVVVVSDKDPEEVRPFKKDAALGDLVTICEITLQAAVATLRPDLPGSCVRELRALGEASQLPLQVRRTLVEAEYERNFGNRQSALSGYQAAVRLSADDKIAADAQRYFGADWADPREDDKAAPSGKAVPSKESQAELSSWQRRSIKLASWELEDPTGKKLRSMDFAGRTVLINIWAAWCSSCSAELPLLQELHSKIAGRDDMAVLTFNVDQEVSLVEPLLKKLGVTVPTVMARMYVQNHAPGISVPRNIIVDADGWMRWERLGFVPHPQWADAMLQKLIETAAEVRRKESVARAP